MTDLKAMPPDVELAWRKVEQSFREEQGRRARALDEQHRQLLEGMSARCADVVLFKPPPEMLSILSPEESARIGKMLRDVERALENLPPELQDALWNCRSMMVSLTQFHSSLILNLLTSNVPLNLQLFSQEAKLNFRGCNFAASYILSSRDILAHLQLSSPHLQQVP